jgi:hypothetical protein
LFTLSIWAFKFYLFRLLTTFHTSIPCLLLSSLFLPSFLLIFCFIIFLLFPAGLNPFIYFFHFCSYSFPLQPSFIASYFSLPIYHYYFSYFKTLFISVLSVSFCGFPFCFLHFIPLTLPFTSVVLFFLPFRHTLYHHPVTARLHDTVIPQVEEARMRFILKKPRKSHPSTLYRHCKLFGANSDMCYRGCHVGKHADKKWCYDIRIKIHILQQNIHKSWQQESKMWISILMHDLLGLSHTGHFLPRDDNAKAIWKIGHDRFPRKPGAINSDDTRCLSVNTLSYAEGASTTWIIIRRSSLLLMRPKVQTCPSKRCQDSLRTR